MKTFFTFLMVLLIAVIISIGSTFIGALVEVAGRWASLSAHDAAVLNGEVSIILVVLAIVAWIHLADSK